MVKKGDTWKDLLTYIEFRLEHLELERQKIPFIKSTPKDRREWAMRKLKAKKQELVKMRNVINADIKEHSKYEYSKVQYLKKQKIEHQKGGEG